MHTIYGHPIIPPFWGLGWHQCRWGYSNTAELKKVRLNYLNNDIPLDALWTDIDMMDQKRNFILNSNFNDAPDFIKYLHEQGQHFIALVDYGIPKKPFDPYYQFGLKRDAFLYSNFTKGDFAEIIQDHSKIINENNLYLDIPYLPGEGRLHTSLSHNTISVNAYSQLNDPKNNFYTMYNVKSLISKRQVKITNEYLQSVKKRPFIVSRANTIGHGKYGFHWLGDNWR